MNYFHRVHQQTPTRFWINNVTQKQAALAIEAGAIGCTQNPAYLSKVLKSEDRQEILEIMDQLIVQNDDDSWVAAELQRRVIAKICEIFLPLYEQSHGREGLVSIQADPFHEDVDTILDNAERMTKLAPNALIKVPATKAGIAAMQELLKMRIPVLATEVMSMDQFLDLCKIRQHAYREIPSPAPMIIAHINGIFDEEIAEYITKNALNIDSDVYGQASWLLAKKMVAYLQEMGCTSLQYLAGGARNLGHFNKWVGVNGGVTINWKNTADLLIEEDGPVLNLFDCSISYRTLDTLLTNVPDFYKAYLPFSLRQEEYEDFPPVVRFRRQFENGWNDILSEIDARRNSQVSV